MKKKFAAKPILAVSQLTVQRGDTILLSDISWTVHHGEHWVILGANGSGKTSLLSTMTGYLTPTSGDIDVLGERFGESDWRELRKNIGLVSSSIRQMIAEEEPALETVVSGKSAMIDLWGEVKPSERKEALKILKQIECEYLKDRPWMFLSQGERQRILIGRALMAKPAILILDEPCAGLDPVAREHFLQFLQRLGSGKNSPTLVLVTHHVEEIMPAFTHALLLKDGQVFKQGKKSEMLNTKTFSALFNARVRVEMHRSRYQISVERSPAVVI